MAKTIWFSLSGVLLHSICRSWKERQRMFLRMVGEYGPRVFFLQLFLYHAFAGNKTNVAQKSKFLFGRKENIMARILFDTILQFEYYREFMKVWR